MRIAVAVKQVLDPDGVNSYALWGKLTVDASGRAFSVGDVIPRIINTYDEQALEVALRIRDAGTPVELIAITVGPEAAGETLKRCYALGADTAIHVRTAAPLTDGFEVAGLLAAALGKVGPVDLVLCGRQGSDYDQGVVPAVLAEHLGAALVTLAAGVTTGDGTVLVDQVTPDGIAVVEARLPAVVSVSNEVGIARAPTSRGMLEARRKRPEVIEAAELGVANAGVELLEISVPDVQGHCELIDGATPAEKAARLFERLEAAGVFG